MSFSNEIKTILKLDDTDWKSNLKSIEKAQQEWSSTYRKSLDTLREKEQKTKKESLAASDAVIEKNKEIEDTIKKIIVAKKDNKDETAKSLTKQKSILTQENQLLKKNAKEAEALHKESIKNIDLNRKSYEKYLNVLSQGREVNTEIKERISLLKEEQNLSTNKQIDKDAEASRKKELSDLKESIILRNEQQKEIEQSIAKDKLRTETLKKQYEEQYVLTNEQKRFNAEIKKLNEYRKAGVISGETYAKHTSELKKSISEQATNTAKASKATNSYTNSVVRHLRQIETLVVAYYTLSRGFQATIGAGIEVNKIIESNTFGVAALISSNTSMIDSQGNMLKSSEKFAMGQEIAKRTLDELRVASVKTAATFPQLIEIFQQAFGQTMSMNGAFGETVDEVKSNTIELSKVLSNVANSIGMPMDRVREEIRSMLSGNASTDSLISTMLFGSPSKANSAVKEAKDRANGVSDLLFDLMDDFKILENTRTYEKGFLNMQDAWSRAMGDMVQKSGLFKDITDAFYEMSTDIRSNTDEIVETFDEIYGAAKKIADVLGNFVIPAVGLASVYALTAAVVALTIAMKANPILWGIATAATVGSFIWENMEEQKEAALELTNTLSATEKQVTDMQQDERKERLENLDKYLAETKAKLVAAEKDASVQMGGGVFLPGESNKEHIEDLALQKELENRVKVIEASKKLIEETVASYDKAMGKVAAAKEKANKASKLMLSVGISEDFVKYVEKTKTAESTLTKKVPELEKLKKELNEAEALFAKKDKREDGYEETESVINAGKERQKVLEKEIAKIKQENYIKELKAKNDLLASRYALEASEKNIIGQSKTKIELISEELNLAGMKIGLGITEKENNLIQVSYNQKLLELFQAQTAEVEKQTKLKSQNIIKNYKRQTDGDASLDTINEASALGYEQLVDIGATEAQLEKFYNTVLDTYDEVNNLELDPIKIEFETDGFSDLLDNVNAIGIAFEGTNETLNNVSKSFSSFYKINEKFGKKEAKLQEKYANDYLALNGDVQKEKELESKFDADTAKLNTQRQSAEIAGYANLAGAMSQAFEEGSAGAKAFQAIQATLGIVNAYTAITTAWASAPFPANLPAVAAATSAVLPNIGTLSSLGGSGGGGGGGSAPTISGGMTAEQNIASIEAEYTPMTDRLDRQIELLESIDKNGSAGALKVELASLTFDRDYKIL